MLSLGALSFAVPWALAVLVALPALWWLLRLMPPAPSLIRFPPIRLLLGLRPKEETSAKTPPWLLALRIALAATVILGAAHPLWNASSEVGGGDGPLVILVDDGWAAAHRWPSRKLAMESLIDQAERRDRPVIVVTTAPGPVRLSARLMSPSEARGILNSLQPKPWPGDRLAAIDELLAMPRLTAAGGGQVIWLSDGLDDGHAADAATRLRRIGHLTVMADPDDELAKVIRPPRSEAGVLIAKVRRPAAGPERTDWVVGVADDGEPVLREPARFAAGAVETEIKLDLPSEQRNRLSRIEIENQSTAAGVVLMDERWRRRPVGLVAGGGALSDQPLLGDTYYVERALEPYTEVRRGALGDLLRRPLAVLVLADPQPIPPDERQAVERWLAQGGVVLRFAGPRAGQEADTLLPVRLRAGDRVLGGSMSWERPAPLAPFRETSPFHGIAVPGDIRVQRQVLAQPSLDLADKTWAELADGTPLVTAERRDRGWLIFIHTTANAAWSNLPLSGAFVEMLRRVVGLSQGVDARAPAIPLPPVEVMDGFGRLREAGPTVLPVSGEALEKTAAGPDHPPGFYGDKAARRALNLSSSLGDPKPLGYLGVGVTREAYSVSREVDLRAWFFVIAFLLALADLVASLLLRQLLQPRGAAAATAAVLVGLALAPGAARAQAPDEMVLAATLETRLAYVITGNRQIDEISRAGLFGMSTIVNRRTAAELGDPIGVVPEADELSFFPLLYWPITGDQAPISTFAASKLNAYMRNGGTILFDTRDQGGGADIATLQGIARALDLPSLVPIPSDHVLTRAYYLMSEFPGRWTGGALWVERAGERINDGVSSVIVGGNDWASAWAMDEAHRPMFAVVPGGDRQREMAYRFGINLVMYTLTGNYKSDQVHLPSILQRLGL